MLDDHLSIFKEQLRSGRASDKLFLHSLLHLLPNYTRELKIDDELRQLLIINSERRFRDVISYTTSELSNSSPINNITFCLFLIELLTVKINIFKNAGDDQSIDNLLRLPTRLSNLYERLSQASVHLPSILESDNFMAKFTKDYLSTLSTTCSTSIYPLERLHLLGFTRYSDRFKSFWSVTLKYYDKHNNSCNNLHLALLDLTPAQIATYFEEFLNALKDSNRDVKQIAHLLVQMWGNIDENTSTFITDVLISGSKVLLDERIVRALTLWISQSKVSFNIFTSILDIWTNPSFIKRVPVDQLTMYSTMILLLIQKEGVKRQIPNTLLNDSNVTHAIPSYLSLPNPFGRLLGMLVAQYLANYDGVDRLTFGNSAFSGSGPGRNEIQRLIQLVDRSRVDDGGAPIQHLEEEQSETSADDISITQHDDSDSDDSIEGYEIDYDKFNTNKPDSDDEEAANDPTILSKRKVNRPVYIAELNDMLRHDGKEGNEAAVLEEVALKWAAALINDKREHRELLENSNNLAFTLLTIQDQFGLDGFEELRSEALRVLIVCSPQRAALNHIANHLRCLIQHLFSTSISLRQRINALQAIGLGVRELSSGIPTPITKTETTTRKAIPENVANHSEVEAILKSLSQTSISDARIKAGNDMPNVARERKLKLQSNKPSKPLIVENTETPSNALEEYRLVDRQSRVQNVRFNQIASEFFIMPLINEIWFALNSQARVRLDKEFLGPLLQTLALMLWSARNAPEFIHILALESLELILALPQYTIAASVNVALAVVSLSNDIEGGRTLAESSKLPLLRRWAENAYDLLESTDENKNCAALLVKIQEIWDRHSTLVMATTLSVGV
ncbi:hypothetical protein E3Q17_03729 [Wallemia mellicola]|uniref:Telomere length regulation protein conserved domain-containing protein n=1 Tax=Wallemia mellicola TaxID=1708541 RepID=A0A4T0LG45_9BASI|nr:hypothetical protein E3Q24_03646 [Wallemia mellicola]TIB80506.1 hypothetical protein E3Q21_03706 [Wallemia mellicola]TIB84552.1 hypothetical protein E3Q20_03645 [Wallemia mellicola]TIB96721.1 hypothetical protein E3Q17_03729 [Wallemia mellicola]TIC21185.1 hypothetical protein E3Q12_03650 [Wallemia mellicola]